MPKKPSHYSTTSMLWNSTAYCDQWEEVLAIYDEGSTLRVVVAKDNQTKAYEAMFIGSRDKVLYRFWGGISFRTMRDSKISCFRLHFVFNSRYNPTFVACKQNKIEKKVSDIITHSRYHNNNKGEFKSEKDALKALEATQMAKKYLQVEKIGMDPIEIYYNRTSKTFYDLMPNPTTEGLQK